MPPISRPSKPWRVITATADTPYGSERAAYDAVNEMTDAGARVTIQRWEHGVWVLWERVRITDGGWEPT